MLHPAGGSTVSPRPSLGILVNIRFVEGTVTFLALDAAQELGRRGRHDTTFFPLTDSWYAGANIPVGKSHQLVGKRCADAENYSKFLDGALASDSSAVALLSPVSITIRMPSLRRLSRATRVVDLSYYLITLS